ncbi:MAG: bacteriophage abortive infection AbiH family protein, partial [Acetatifactor sp.]|nr:bacteriophage abortive infection AbiH family protein [Acetatifactor sp.]
IRDNQDICCFRQFPFFYEICKAIETKNWVDIENEYYRFLTSFLVATPKYEAPNILNNELDFIKLKLIEYLTLIQKKQIQGLPVNEDIKNEILSPISNKEISVDSFAKKAWKEFIEKRKNLLDEEWKELLQNYNRKYVTERLIEINAFKNRHWRGRLPLDFLRPDKIMLLNFNYTKTADMYLPSGGSDCFSVNHIHGELANPQGVIFGYGDDLDDNYKKLLKLAENEYLRNIKSINYLSSENYRRMQNFIESAPYQVFIMGHSCGNSDRTLLNMLFEHKNCVSVKPFFYRKKDGTDNYLEIVQNICRNFKDMKLMRSCVVNQELCHPLST